MKPDWRDTVRVATDVAVLGLLIVAASLPVLTTGAAFATASFAVHQFLTDDRWPRPGAVWRVFRRALLPGALATAAAAVAGWLIAVNVAALASGTVPGGAVLLGLTIVIAAGATGYAALALVALGGTLASAPAGGAWRAAARAAAAARPVTVAAVAGVLALAGLLAVLVHPILAACLVGYALYAVHVVTRRVAAHRSPAAGR